MSQGSAFIFCSDCQNLLYPESTEERELLWRCARCHRTERHNDAAVVYSANLRREGAEMKERELLADFAQDPTAQRDPDKTCARCSSHGVACMINPLEQPTEDMSLFFACPSCRHVWKDTAQTH